MFTKPTTKEKTPKEADVTPRVNIQDFCEEHYEDILPVTMDKIRGDKRKEVHARLDFEESPKKRRIREGSQNSSARTLSARYRNPSERLKVRDRLRYNERHVLDRLEIVLRAETALRGDRRADQHMDNSRPRRPHPRYRKGGGKVNPCHPAYQRAAPAMGDTESQGQKDTSLRRRMTWRCPGYVKRKPQEYGFAAELILHGRGIRLIQDLKADFLA
ncbi:hypothetical protein Tco_0038313 [Tanacetum coccineum]